MVETKYQIVAIEKQEEEFYNKNKTVKTKKLWLIIGCLKAVQKRKRCPSISIRRRLASQVRVKNNEKFVIV